MATTIQLGWRFYSDTGTLSGGSWLSALPLANLQDPLRSLVATLSFMGTGFVTVFVVRHWLQGGGDATHD